MSECKHQIVFYSEMGSCDLCGDSELDIANNRIAELEAELDEIKSEENIHNVILQEENKRLLKVKAAAEKMITEGYADSFSNWVCPSEYAFPLEQALAEGEE